MVKSWALALVAGCFASAVAAKDLAPETGVNQRITIAPGIEGELIHPGTEVKGAGASESFGVAQPGFFFDAALPVEAEPNNSFGQANALTLNGGAALMQGNVQPNADVDWYSFAGTSGDRVYAAITTSSSANGSTDSQLRIFRNDGTTLVEFDDDDGSFGTLSSVIAGAVLPATETYYVEIRHFSATSQLRPYRLYLQTRAGAAVAEVEPNDVLPGQTLPGSRHVAGTLSSGTDVDFYALTLNAGDTVFLALDLDPERDGDTIGQLGFGPFGNPPLIGVVNDTGSGTPDAEALAYTVLQAGSYSILVSAPSGTGGSYTLSTSVYPALNNGVSCQTFTSTNVPQTIPTGPGLVDSTITIPSGVRIADLDVSIDLTHANMPDLDVQLISPRDNSNSLFTDIGAATQPGMNLRLDDEAAVPLSVFSFQSGTRVQPELSYRLAAYDGIDAGGTWTLRVNDDTTANGGTLNGWALHICQPPPPPACAAGFTTTTVYSTDFEANDGGFTSSGTANEWERGLPSLAPITSCASGANCFKTDLDGTYDASSNQVLQSPAIDLTGLSAPVVVRFSHRYQMESASFDTYGVDAVGGSTVRLFEWSGATQNDSIGNPAVTVAQTAGWGQVVARADALAGAPANLRFSLVSDSSVNLSGVAVDDVSVTACRALSADLAISKTNGTTSVTAGAPTSYTIIASNAGPDAAPAATVTDTFPASLTGCTWTCIAAGGAGCGAASGAGNINQVVNLPVGGTTTFSATCTVSAAATGTVSNTASISNSFADPNGGNNNATDEDTVARSANVGITKTNGTSFVTPGAATTYTIVASNAGPSNAPGTTVADTFPASLTGCTWTCVAAGGAGCGAASGAGNINQVVNLPVGGTTTFSATCTVAPTAVGTVVNTATVAVGAGITDPSGANNSATDTDTVSQVADLSITKTDGQTTVLTGATGTYTIVVRNAGPSTATAAPVTDTFPAGFAGVTWTCVAAGGGTCGAASGAGNIATTATLPGNATATYTATGTYQNTVGTVSNTATVAAPAGLNDPTPANNSATDTTDVRSPATLSATKTATGEFRASGFVTYTITISNAGPRTQLDNPGAEFIDDLPVGFVYQGATASAGTISFDAVTRRVSWSGSLAPAATVTIDIRGRISNGVVGSTLSNQGVLQFDANGDGINEATALTDDPTVAGGANPTNFSVAPPLPIPTLGPWGLGLLAALFGLVGLTTLRRR